jgi:hypothetical protein
MELRVTKVNKVFSNGIHNAFPSIIRFGDFNYISFRSAANHLSFDGKITVIRSSNLADWEQVASLQINNCDLRDPAMTVKEGQLWIYVGLRKENVFKRETLAYASKDGMNFSQQTLTGIPEGYWLWDIVEFKNTLYASAYTRDEEGLARQKTCFFSSNDGAVFSPLSNAPAPGGEASIDFSLDGIMYVLLRDDSNGSLPHLAISRAPYKEFDSCKTLPLRLQGPKLKRMNNASVIIGRDWDEPGRRNLRTDIHILEDNRILKFVSTLPSGGDTSYASWLDIAPGKAMLVYYSAHEHCMDYDFDTDIENDPAAPEHNFGADIFLAHLCYK